VRKSKLCRAKQEVYHLTQLKKERPSSLAGSAASAKGALSNWWEKNANIVWEILAETQN